MSARKGNVGLLSSLTYLLKIKGCMLHVVCCLCLPVSFLSIADHGDAKASITTQSVVAISHSFSLDNGIKIDIVLPPNYHKTEAHYPLVFVFDSQRYLLLPAAYQASLAWKEYTPQFIIVGIDTTNAKRRHILGNGAANLISTISNDIIPRIDKNYRTNQLRILFGWEKAAGFAVELLAKEPELFSAYILVSGTFITSSRLATLENTLKNSQLRQPFVFQTLDKTETWAIDENNALKKILANTLTDRYQFVWTSGEDHYSTPYTAFSKGLSAFLSDYRPLRFYSMAEYADFGGLAAIKKHYSKRAKMYLTSSAVHEQTIHFLLNQAVNEGNFNVFSQIYTAYPDFIASKRYRPVFINKFASFCDGNRDLKTAESIYKIGVTQNPLSADLQEKLGDIYLKTGDHQQAQAAFQASKQLALNEGETERIARINAKLMQITG